MIEIQLLGVHLPTSYYYNATFLLKTDIDRFN